MSKYNRSAASLMIEPMEARLFLSASPHAKAGVAETPFGGTPYVITNKIEAENFNNGGEGVAFHDATSNNIGGKYRNTAVDLQTATDTGGGFYLGWATANEFVDYTVSVPYNATYSLSMRVAAAAGGGKFHFNVDGADATGAITMPNTGGWQHWTTITPGNVHLTAGQHVLRLQMDSVASSSGYVGDFNFFQFARVHGTPFSGTAAPIPGLVQAENFDAGGEGLAYHDTDPQNRGGKGRATGVDQQNAGDTGGGLTVAFVHTGEWLEYTVNTAATRTYTLDFRVAQRKAGGTFHLEEDGHDVTGELSVPSTGSWHTFTTVSKSNVALTAGRHVFRLAFDSVAANGFTGNFNWFRAT